MIEEYEDVRPAAREIAIKNFTRKGF